MRYLIGYIYLLGSLIKAQNVSTLAVSPIIRPVVYETIYTTGNHSLIAVTVEENDPRAQLATSVISNPTTTVPAILDPAVIVESTGSGPLRITIDWIIDSIMVIAMISTIIPVITLLLQKRQFTRWMLSILIFHSLVSVLHILEILVRILILDNVVVHVIIAATAILSMFHLTHVLHMYEVFTQKCGKIFLYLALLIHVVTAWGLYIVAWMPDFLVKWVRYSAFGWLGFSAIFCCIALTNTTRHVYQNTRFTNRNESQATLTNRTNTFIVLMIAAVALLDAVGITAYTVGIFVVPDGEGMGARVVFYMMGIHYAIVNFLFSKLTDMGFRRSSMISIGTPDLIFSSTRK